MAVRRTAVEKKAAKLNKLRDVRDKRQAKLLELKSLEKALERAACTEGNDDNRLAKLAKACAKITRRTEMQVLSNAVYEHMKSTRREQLICIQKQTASLKAQLAHTEDQVTGVQQELEKCRVSVQQTQHELQHENVSLTDVAKARASDTQRVLRSYKTKTLTSRLFEVEQVRLKEARVSTRKLALKRTIKGKQDDHSRILAHDAEVKAGSRYGSLEEMEGKLKELCKVTSTETVEQMINRLEQLKVVQENLGVMRTQQEQQIALLKAQLEDLQADNPQSDVPQEHEVVDQDVIRVKTSKAVLLKTNLLVQERNAASCLSFLSALAKRVRQATGAELEENIKVSNMPWAVEQLAQQLSSMQELIVQSRSG
jgi:hypothetical protein